MHRKSPAVTWTQRSLRPRNSLSRRASRCSSHRRRKIRTPSPSPGSSPPRTTSSSLSDLGAYSQSNPVRLGGPPECPERPFCQPGLEQVYAVSVESFKPLDAGGPLTVRDLLNGGIDVGLVFSSAGNVTANDLVVLEDDQGLQTAENILPAVHTASLTDTISQALDERVGGLDD